MIQSTQCIAIVQELQSVNTTASEASYVIVVLGSCLYSAESFLVQLVAAFTSSKSVNILYIILPEEVKLPAAGRWLG